jgi:hypothetical protein
MLRITNGLLPASQPSAPRAGGRPLPPFTRHRMEQLFGVSFEDVRIHVGGVPGQVGAVAFTSGSDIYFAPGHFDPATPHGIQLIAHELTHVVQQRSGRVRSPAGGGAAIVNDPALEEEARQMGARALSGAAPPFLPAAHEYHRGVSPAQRGRDMRVIQRMRATRSTQKTFADSIGKYVNDLDGFRYLKVKDGAQLFHSSSADLTGKDLTVPAFLGGPWGREYGESKKKVKWYRFTVQREAKLVLLNHAGNLARLLDRMESAPQVCANLVQKASIKLNDDDIVTSFKIYTVGSVDSVVANWFMEQGYDGWYVDPSLEGGMQFEEVMISQSDVLSTGNQMG